jgi:hypothetical protein
VAYLKILSGHEETEEIHDISVGIIADVLRFEPSLLFKHWQ